MMVQNILRIDLTEIPALEITCEKCGAMLSIPFPKQDVSQHWECLGCNTRLWDGEQDQAYVRLLGIVRSLNNWKQLQPPRKFNIGVSLLQSPSKETSRLKP